MDQLNLFLVLLPHELHLCLKLLLPLRATMTHRQLLHLSLQIPDLVLDLR